MEALLVQAILAAIGGATLYVAYLVAVGIWHLLFGKSKDEILDQPRTDRHRAPTVAQDSKNTRGDFKPAKPVARSTTVQARLSLAEGRAIRAKRLGLKQPDPWYSWSRLASHPLIIAFAIIVFLSIPISTAVYLSR